MDRSFLTTPPSRELADDDASSALTSDDRDWLALEDPPPPQLSLVRVAALLVTICALVAGGFFLIVERGSPAPSVNGGLSAFAPYVDATLTPTYPFEVPSADPVNHLVLGFIVAAPGASCTPNWGGYYTLAAAERALNLDERIAQVEKQGGNVMLSFGGRDHSELAVSCANVPALTAAYLAPIERYKARTIDLDIEGAALANTAANLRRARAIAAAQHSEATRGRPLKVWLTLPVARDGLDEQALATITSLLNAHVALSGVNVLAMDFARVPAHGMTGAVEGALAAAHGQLDAIYRRAGIDLSSAEIWQHLGLTVMIGENDVSGEQLKLGDARALTAFANDNHLGRISMWSLNRDSQCGVFSTGVLSNTCSGERQRPLEFTSIFSHFAGTVTASGTADATQVLGQATQTQPDDPARSPYPIWLASAAYVAGYKVVWHGDIYEAKWYALGIPPDEPTPDANATPWLLIGPVPAGSKAPTPTLLDASRHPLWSPSAVYHAGDRVSYKGLPYEAKWFAQGIPPETALPADPQSAWEPLYTVPGEPAGAVAQEAAP